MYKAALFDLDGTLLDTAPDLATAANAMRGHYGMPLLREDVITSFVGKGMENLVRRTLAGSLDPVGDPEPDVAEALAVFREHYHRVNGDRVRIFEGVAAGLRELSDLGLSLGVVTNKPTEFVRPLLEQTGLRGFFEVLVCGDTCERKKPDPMPVFHACELMGVEPEQTVLVGDSVNDALAGRAAGTAVLVVPYGYNEGRDVSTLDVDALVRDVPEVVVWVRQAHYPIV
ncbi:MAG: phosphoglycolate phosphatase [Pigmentiphaga sp.]